MNAEEFSHFIDSVNDKTVDDICECVHNVINTDLKFSGKQIKNLKKHIKSHCCVKRIKTITNKRVPLFKRRKNLKMEGKGLPLLLASTIPFLISLFKNKNASKKVSSYSKMYLVTPSVYDKLLKCLDDGDKKITQNLNKTPPANLPLRPSEQILQNLSLSDMSTISTAPTPSLSLSREIDTSQQRVRGEMVDFLDEFPDDIFGTDSDFRASSPIQNPVISQDNPNVNLIPPTHIDPVDLAMQIDPQPLRGKKRRFQEPVIVSSHSGQPPPPPPPPGVMMTSDITPKPKKKPRFQESEVISSNLPPPPPPPPGIPSFSYDKPITTSDILKAKSFRKPPKKTTRFSTDDVINPEFIDIEPITPGDILQSQSFRRPPRFSTPDVINPVFPNVEPISSSDLLQSQSFRRTPEEEQFENDLNLTQERLNRLVQMPDTQGYEEREDVWARLRGRMTDLNRLEQEQQCVETTQGRICDIPQTDQNIERKKDKGKKRFSTVDRLLIDKLHPSPRVLPYRPSRLLKDQSFRKKVNLTNDDDENLEEMRILQDRLNRLREPIVSEGQESREEVWSRLRARNNELNRIQEGLQCVETTQGRVCDIPLPSTTQPQNIIRQHLNPLQCPVCRKVFKSGKGYVKSIYLIFTNLIQKQY